MRVSFLLENLLAKLPLLNQAVSSRTQLPALSGFLISAEKGKTEISATDLEIGAVVSVPGNTDEEGSVLVPARAFSEIVSSIKEEKLTIEAEGGRATILGKRLRATLNVLDEAEFPKITEGGVQTAAKIKREDFDKELGRIVFAAAQDASKAAFSAVLLRREGEGIVVVATDSHRLSKNFIPQTSKGGSGQFLVSAKTIRALSSSKEQGDVEIGVADKGNQAAFSLAQDLVVGRLIDAEYPEFEKIIPQDYSTKTEFDTTEMQAALKTSSVFSRDNANIVKFSVKKDSVSVFAKSPELGENKIDVPAKTTGEENEIAFNQHYVSELLQNIASERTIFEMTGPLNPGVFKIPSNKHFIHLIMPIRIREEDLG